MELEPSFKYDFYDQEFFDNKNIQLKISKKPKVSILIPVYNELIYTLNCLHSLSDDCEKHEVEIIVINDNSTDDTKDYLDEIEGLKVINNSINLGFLKNINNGLKAAKGEYVLLLNNDVVVLPNLLEELFSIFETKSNVGAVGAMAIHPSGVLLEAGSTMFANGEVINNGRLASVNNPHYNYVKIVDYCSGYCLLIKRLFPNGNLAQLDELFLPAYYEETDLCMQLKYNYNLDVYYQPFAKLIHFESISYANKKNNKKESLIKSNRFKFENKWRQVLQEKHFLRQKKHRDYNVLSKKANAIMYLQDFLSESVFKEIESQNIKGKKVTIILKSKNGLSENKMQFFRKQGIEVLYPYTSSRGRFRSFFKIFNRTLPAHNEIKTNKIFYRLYFKIFN